VAAVLTRPDPAALRAAVDDADLRVLVMCLVHLTGDLRWLEAPYRPMRDVRLVADPQAGYPPEVQAEIRETVIALLANGAGEPVINDPGNELLLRMMSVCLGEIVPPEYLPMMREDMGFTSEDPVWGVKPDAKSLAETDTLIIGAGLSGLAMGYKLGKLGVPYTIVERNPEVGGTWYENRYPGCGVDTPNHFYSFSFAPNHGWKHYFSPRDELQAYVERFATDSGVRRNIRFGCEVTGATWNEKDSRWSVSLRTAQGTSQASAKVLVAATGHFERPSVPSIKGTEHFAGRLFHSACWPDDVVLDGARVAIIGTGASSMQIVPTIADRVASLDIYQRSPQWVRPVPEYSLPVKPGTQWLLEHVPYYATWNRFTLFWRYGDGLLRFLRKDPHWQHPARSLNRINDRHRQEMVDYMQRELAERPELLADCVPSYPPYGKRILLDKGWFKALCRPNVELVTAAISHLDPGGIVTRDGKHRSADVVILATGFVVTDLAARLNVTGRDGRTLAEDWAGENPTAHLGISVPGFPNFFCMYGPNTNMGHGGSVIFLAECQSRYISGCIVEMVGRGAASMEATREARDDWIRRVDQAHGELVWTHPGMSTYYRNRHGRVVSPSPFRLVDTWAMTHRPKLDDFLLAYQNEASR
jgi:4-hydroxyacetophenone monooxygenase